MYIGSFKRFYYYYQYCKFSNMQNKEPQKNSEIKET